MAKVDDLRALLAKGRDGDLMVQVPLGIKNALPYLLDLAQAGKAMLELEERRMREHDFFDEMKSYACPCPGCVGLRAAFAKLEKLAG